MKRKHSRGFFRWTKVMKTFTEMRAIRLCDFWLESTGWQISTLIRRGPLQTENFCAEMGEYDFQSLLSIIVPPRRYGTWRQQIEYSCRTYTFTLSHQKSHLHESSHFANKILGKIWKRWQPSHSILNIDRRRLYQRFLHNIGSQKTLRGVTKINEFYSSSAARLRKI